MPLHLLLMPLPQPRSPGCCDNLHGPIAVRSAFAELPPSPMAFSFYQLPCHVVQIEIFP